MTGPQIVLSILTQLRLAIKPLLRCSRAVRQASCRVLEATGGPADIEVIPP